VGGKNPQITLIAPNHLSVCVIGVINFERILIDRLEETAAEQTMNFHRCANDCICPRIGFCEDRHLVTPS
jgi:hypothetical protein